MRLSPDPGVHSNMPRRERASASAGGAQRQRRRARAGRLNDPPSESEESRARREPEPESTDSTLKNFFARLLSPSQPFGHASGLLLAQLLEWQALFLRSYQEAFRKHSPAAPLDEQLRFMARAMMATYLEIAKSIPDSREKILTTHAAFVESSLDTIEQLKRRLGYSEPSRPQARGDREPGPGSRGVEHAKWGRVTNRRARGRTRRARAVPR